MIGQRHHSLRNPSDSAGLPPAAGPSKLEPNMFIFIASFQHALFHAESEKSTEMDPNRTAFGGPDTPKSKKMPPGDTSTYRKTSTNWKKNATTEARHLIKTCFSLWKALPVADRIPTEHAHRSPTCQYCIEASLGRQRGGHRTSASRLGQAIRTNATSAHHNQEGLHTKCSLGKSSRRRLYCYCRE